MRERNKLYGMLLLSCLVGYVWLCLNYSQATTSGHLSGVCIVKKVLNIPCPSCGTTRALLALGNGEFQSAFLINPFSYIIAFILIFIPFWLLIDIVNKRQTFFLFYKKSESIIIKRPVAISLILLTVVNWIWNINKGV